MASNFPGYIAPIGGGVGGGAGVSGQTSGVFADALQLVDTTFTTAELISGGKAVAFNKSGLLQIAMASVSGRMPAIGIARGNHAAASLATVYLAGQLFNDAASGTPWNFSGWTDQPLYVGASGDVIASGPPSASGNIQQTLGVSISQSGLMVNIGTPLEGVQVGSGDIGSGAITGQAGGGFLCVGSGTLGSYDGSSGMTTWGSVTVAPFNSGLNFGVAPLVTAETISGGRAVYINQSGKLGVAMAAVSGRMPAIGIVIDNAAAGVPVNVFTQIAVQFTSGLNNYSGYLGQPVWVGRSGQLTCVSGSWSSGGYASGDIGQKIGVTVNSGALLVNLNTTVWSGGPLGEATGGVI